MQESGTLPQSEWLGTGVVVDGVDGMDAVDGVGVGLGVDRMVGDGVDGVDGADGVDGVESMRS